MEGSGCACIAKEEREQRAPRNGGGQTHDDLGTKMDGTSYLREWKFSGFEIDASTEARVKSDF